MDLKDIKGNKSTPQQAKEKKPSWIIKIGGGFLAVCFTFVLIGGVFSLFADGSKTSETQNIKTENEYRNDSQKFCTKKWEKRGVLNRGPYNLCINDHAESYQEFKHIHAQYENQDFYKSISLSHCVKKWTKRNISNVNMIRLCLQDEIEGFKDVTYYQGKHGSEVTSVADDALRKFKSWNMAAYIVKQKYD